MSETTERRRHPRINIQEEIKKAKALKGAQFIVAGHSEPLEVFDMSLSGLAISAFEPKSPGDQMVCEIVLGDSEPQALEAEVMWSSDKMLGLRIVACEPEVRMSIADFLEDRVVGQHMIRVSDKFFASHVEFSHWFHGPNNTNVFLWLSDDKKTVAKAMVSFDGQSMIFEAGEFYAGGAAVDWDEQGTYSAESLPENESGDLVLELQKDSPLVQRSIELLSQLQFEKELIEKLLKSIETS